MQPKSKKSAEKEAKDEQYRYKYKSEYKSDWDSHQHYIEDFDAYEAMLQGYVWDSQSARIDGSKITDSYASTLAIERAARVMGKLPEGNTEASGKADAGKAAFMDIIRQKWYYRNANAQQPFFIKLRLWQLYSSVYGYMPMFVDWNVTGNGYVGPDCWLWNPRNLIPQQGRVSIADMDYVTALTWVGRTFLEAKLKDSLGKDKLEDLNDETKVTKANEDDEDSNDGWNLEAVQLLLENVDHTAKDPDYQQDTLVTRTRSSNRSKKGICLATRYEAGEDGEWVTFAPDHGYVEVRRIKNPHKNGKIPFVIKYSLPLFDSPYGMGDFQRAKPLQFARDGLTNFYFASLKRNLSPGIIVNANGVLKHTLDVTSPNPILMETVPNSIRPMPTNTAGLSTYQAAQSALTGSLLSLYGSQNAATPGAETLNPSQGKTPQAIELYADKEATRDGQEREMLETAIEELTDRFNEITVNIGTEEIPISLFSDDLEEIRKSGLADVTDIFKNWKPNEQMTSGELKIDPKKLKGVDYRFNITPGSTAKLSKERQRQSLADFMAVIGKFQNVLQDDPNAEIDWPLIMKKYEDLSDIKGANEFIKIKDGPSPQEQMLMQQAQELQAQLAEMQSQLQEATAALEEKEQLNVGGNQYNNPEVAEAARRLEEM